MNKSEFKYLIKCSGGTGKFLEEYERPRVFSGYFSINEAAKCKNILEKITNKTQILYYVSKESVYFKEKGTELITRLSNHGGEVGQSDGKLNAGHQFEYCFAQIDINDLDPTYDLPKINNVCKTCADKFIAPYKSEICKTCAGED